MGNTSLTSTSRVKPASLRPRRRCLTTPLMQGCIRDNRATFVLEAAVAGGTDERPCAMIRLFTMLQQCTHIGRFSDIVDAVVKTGMEEIGWLVHK